MRNYDSRIYLVRITLVLLIGLALSPARSAPGSTLFTDLEETSLIVFEQVMRHSGTNAFSVCLDADLRASGVPPQMPFRRLPNRFWDKLRPRLEAKGLNLSAYVLCEKLRRNESGSVVLKANNQRAVVFVITGMAWHGDGRLLVSWTREVGPLSSNGGTLALGLKEGRWVILEMTKVWVS